MLRNRMLSIHLAVKVPIKGAVDVCFQKVSGACSSFVYNDMFF